MVPVSVASTTSAPSIETRVLPSGDAGPHTLATSPALGSIQRWTSVPCSSLMKVLPDPVVPVSRIHARCKITSRGPEGRNSQPIPTRRVSMRTSLAPSLTRISGTSRTLSKNGSSCGRIQRRAASPPAGSTIRVRSCGSSGAFVKNSMRSKATGLPFSPISFRVRCSPSSMSARFQRVLPSGEIKSTGKTCSVSTCLMRPSKSTSPARMGAVRKIPSVRPNCTRFMNPPGLSPIIGRARQPCTPDAETRQPVRGDATELTLLTRLNGDVFQTRVSGTGTVCPSLRNDDSART